MYLIRIHSSNVGITVCFESSFQMAPLQKSIQIIIDCFRLDSFTRVTEIAVSDFWWENLKLECCWFFFLTGSGPRPHQRKPYHVDANVKFVIFHFHCITL